MSKQLGVKQILDLTAAGGMARRRHPVSFASYRGHILCKPCNKHLKDLEDAVIPLLVPMAMGRATVALDRDSQALLALWASKTAMMLIAMRSELRDLVPQDHRDSVRHSGSAPAECWVGYFPWKGGTNIFTSDDALTIIGVSEARRVENQAYSAIFTFKGAGFKVIGFVTPPPSRFVIDGGTQQIIQVWPVTPGLAAWPPDGGPLGQRAFTDLVTYAPLKDRAFRRQPAS